MGWKFITTQFIILIFYRNGIGRNLLKPILEKI
jgi:hypothetical protein